MLPPDAEFRKRADKAVRFAQKTGHQQESGALSDEELFEKKKKLSEYLENLKKSHLEIMGKQRYELNNRLLELEEKKNSGIIINETFESRNLELFEEKTQLESDMESLETYTNDEYVAYLGRQFDEIRLDIKYGRKPKKTVDVPGISKVGDHSKLKKPPMFDKERKARVRHDEPPLDWAKSIGVLLIVLAIFLGAYYGSFWITIIFISVMVTVLVVWVGSLFFTTKILELERGKPYTAFQCVMLQSLFNIPIAFFAYFSWLFLVALPFLNFIISIYTVGVTYRISYLKGLVVTVNSLFFTYIIFMLLMMFVIRPMIGLSIMSLFYFL